MVNLSIHHLNDNQLIYEFMNPRAESYHIQYFDSVIHLLDLHLTIKYIIMVMVIDMVIVIMFK